MPPLRHVPVSPDEGTERHETPRRVAQFIHMKDKLRELTLPAANGLGIKLFGSRYGVMKERRRQREQGGAWLIIHPCSSFRFYWDMAMLVLLLCNLVMLPVAIAFFSEDLSFAWILFNCVSDAVFIVDIAVNFRTGIICSTSHCPEEVILEPWNIARHYLRTWFLLDLISSIPMDYIYVCIRGSHYTQVANAGRALRMFRLGKLLSMLRLLRLTRFVRYISHWEEFFNFASHFLGIMHLIMFMFLLGHWNACLQYLGPMLMGFPNNSWVVRYEIMDKPWTVQYSWSLFKALSHMLGIGYGLMPPIRTDEAWITLASILTGITCYALVVGNVAALLQCFNMSQNMFETKMKHLEEYMAVRKLPPCLKLRATNFYRLRYDRKMFQEKEVLLQFSECIKKAVISYNWHEFLSTFPFPSEEEKDLFVDGIMSHVDYEVFQPGDVIIKEGARRYHLMKMYFIHEGLVDVTTANNQMITCLSDGNYFGEISILANIPRTATVKAVTHCHLYSLHRDDFLAVVKPFPNLIRIFKAIAYFRLQQVQEGSELMIDYQDQEIDQDLLPQNPNYYS